MHDELLNVTAQLFLFWRAFSDQIERGLPGNKPSDNNGSSSYYYNYDDDYLSSSDARDIARESVNKFLGANSTQELREVAADHFQHADWRYLTQQQPGDLNRNLQMELAAISRLVTRRPTRIAESNLVTSYTVYHISVWIERYLYPPMLFVGLIGNALTFIVLSRPIISSHGSSAVYLKMLCVHDTANLCLGVIRKWIHNVWRFDIRETSTFMCKVHRFGHYTCLDVSHWVLAAITIDRVVALVKPSYAKKVCRKRVALWVVAGIWIFFGSLNSFVLVGVGLEPVIPTMSQTTPMPLPTAQMRAVTPAGLRGPSRHSPAIAADPPPIENATKAPPTVKPIRYQCKFVNKDAEFFAINFHRWLIASFYVLGPFGIVLVGNIVITKQLFQKKAFIDSIYKGIGRIRRGSGFENKATVRATTAMMYTSSVTFLVLGTPTFLLLVSGPYFEPKLNRSIEGKAYLFFLRAVESFLTYFNHSSHFFFYAIFVSFFRREFYQVVMKVGMSFVKLTWRRGSSSSSEKSVQSFPSVASICVRPDLKTWRQIDTSEFRIYTVDPIPSFIAPESHFYKADVIRGTFDSGLGGMSTSVTASELNEDDENMIRKQKIATILKNTQEYRRRLSLDTVNEHKKASVSFATRRFTLNNISEADVEFCERDSFANHHSAENATNKSLPSEISC